MPPRKDKKKTTPAIPGQGREVVYPRITVREAWGDNPITQEDVVDLLGITYDADEAKKKGCNDPLFTDLHGKPVYCTNNVSNRPFYMDQICKPLIQIILKRRWAGPNGQGWKAKPEEADDFTINGEPIIISRTGLVLSGQHTLVAAYIAEQTRTSLREKYHWEEYWDGPVVIDKLVVAGVSDRDEVVNTIDTGKGRSDSDVLYRQPWFRSMKPGVRKVASRMAAHAVRILWHRTGAADAFTTKRTHDETIDFVARHPKLLECITHVAEEDSGGKLGSYIGVGYMAGLMYLMGSSSSEVSSYKSDRPSEETLDWANWPRAAKFVTWLAKAKPTDPIKFALKPTNPDGAVIHRTNAEKWAILAKAWTVFAGEKKDPSEEDLKLAYKPGHEGELAECPTFGGIDLGNPDSKPQRGRTIAARVEDTEEEGEELTEEDIENGKEEVQSERANGVNKPAPTLFDQLDSLKRKHGDKILLFRGPTAYTAYQEDALELTQNCGIKSERRPDRLTVAKFPLTEARTVLNQLSVLGFSSVILEPTADGKDYKVAEKMDARGTPKPHEQRPTKDLNGTPLQTTISRRDPKKDLDDELAIESGAADLLNEETIGRGKENRKAARAAKKAGKK